jgi:hypothetical protein
VVNRPDVASKLPKVPSQAKAEVDRNPALLKTQIDEGEQAPGEERESPRRQLHARQRG